jgi:hypothetical protein
MLSHTQERLLGVSPHVQHLLGVSPHVQHLQSVVQRKARQEHWCMDQFILSQSLLSCCPGWWCSSRCLRPMAGGRLPVRYIASSLAPEHWASLALKTWTKASSFLMCTQMQTLLPWR